MPFGVRAVLAAVLVLAAACTSAPPPVRAPSPTPPALPTPAVAPTLDPAAPALRYVVLGDSYSIGTSVSGPERWPDQLMARLAADPPGRRLELVDNLAVNGQTSGTVLRTQLMPLDQLRPEFVSLLLGVNDVVQGVDEATYASNTTGILDTLLRHLPPTRIVCVETPDYTVTPAGASFGDPVVQRAGIERTNRTLQRLCEARGIRFVGGIFAVSQGAGSDRTLVASDGLHPSGAQYSRWVDLIEPVVRELLETP